MIYGECPRRDFKIIIGDLNDKIGRENVYREVTGKYSLHTKSNDNFASLQNTVIGSTIFNYKDIEISCWKHL
jgi:hypothetical protein